MILVDPVREDTGVDKAESTLSFEASMLRLGACGTVAETAVEELLELI